MYTKWSALAEDFAHRMFLVSNTFANQSVNQSLLFMQTPKEFYAVLYGYGILIT